MEYNEKKAIEAIKNIHNNLYSELTKAKDKCYDAKEGRLFDMCQYHIDILDDQELTDIDNQQILNFAKDVYQIAVLKNKLNPIV